MRIAIIGSKELSCRVLEICIKQGHDVLAVLTRDAEKGMKIWHEQLKHRSLHEVAANHNIPAYEGLKVNDSSTRHLLETLNLDLIFSCFWSEIFKEETLVIPKLGVFNIHAGALPKYRGSRPIPWALINGEKKIGITLHKMMTGVDNGPIVSQALVDVDTTDNAGIVYNKLTEAAIEMFENALPAIYENDFQLKLQEETDSTYYPPGEPFAGRVNPLWNDELKQNFIRAFTFPPFSGAKPFYNRNIDDNIKLCFIDSEEYFDLEMSKILSEINATKTTVFRKYFKLIAHEKGANQHLLLSGKYDKVLRESRDIFNLKKLGFEAHIIPTDFTAKIPDWKLQPYYIENGQLEIPSFSIESIIDFNHILANIERLQAYQNCQVFLPILCRMDLRTMLRVNFNSKIQEIGTSELLAYFN